MIVPNNARQAFSARARSKSLNLALDHQRQHVSFPERDRTKDNRSHGNDRAPEQWPHEQTALSKKAHDGLHRTRYLSDDCFSDHLLAKAVKEMSMENLPSGRAETSSGGMGGICAS